MSEEREEEEEQGIKPIPDRSITELTAYRTLALREAWLRILMWRS